MAITIKMSSPEYQDACKRCARAGTGDLDSSYGLCCSCKIVDSFKQLLGLQSLPTNGSEAMEASRTFFNAVNTTLRPTPLLEQLSEEHAYLQGNHTSSDLRGGPKQKFADVTTGMRLRYLEWPNTGSDVVILLHGISQCAEIWTTIASHLSDRGYKVYALDLRGHGASSRSSGGRYTADLLAEDVHAFIVAKDLYIRPVAVVGSGIGAITALTLACAAPNLVGAVACIEFGLPPEITATAVDVPLNENQETNSALLMPWWSFWLGQAAEFTSAAECAAFLCSPLSNLGPAVLSSLLPQTQDQPDTPPSDPGTILSSLGRPPAAAAHEASIIVKSSQASGWSTCAADNYTIPLKMDQKFFFSFDIYTLARALVSLKPHLLVLHGEMSAMVPPESATALASLPRNPASKTTVQLPQQGHHIVNDASREVLDSLVAFLEGPAVRCFDIAPGRDSRRPELLGIRPLQEYESLEAAQRALGPRSLPSAADVEEALEKLRIESGGVASDSEGEVDEGAEAEGRRRQTALAKDPSDYFGFVG